MRTSAFALLSAILLWSSAFAQAPVQAQAPAQKRIGQDAPPPAEQILTPELPNFKIAHQELKDDKRVFEFLPNGQTLEKWTERVAIIVFLNVTKKDPKEVAEALQGEWKNSCATYSSHPVETRFEKGYPTTIFAMQCSDTAPKPGRLANEFVMAKVIQGIDSLYLVQRAWHSATEKVPPPLRDTKTGDQWADFIRGIEICDARLRGQPCAALGIR